MSKIVDAITATQTNRRRHKPTKLFDSVFTVCEEFAPSPTETEYRISVTLGARYWVSSELQADSAFPFLEEAVKSTKKKVIEAIFGEFREDFRNLEHALYNSEVETARTMLQAFEKKMFEVNHDTN